MNIIELSLIENARRGDSHALNELFSQHQKYIFNLMLQLTGDVAQADDLTQETFLIAFRKIHSFRSQASFRTWVSRIAINLFRLDFRRKPKHYSLCREKITVPSHQDDPERVVIKSELQWSFSIIFNNICRTNIGRFSSSGTSIISVIKRFLRSSDGI